MYRYFSISLLSNICSHFQLAGQFLAHSESIFIQIIMKYDYSLLLSCEINEAVVHAACVWLDLTSLTSLKHFVLYLSHIIYVY